MADNPRGGLAHSYRFLCKMFLNECTRPTRWQIDRKSGLVNKMLTKATRAFA